MLHAIKIKTAWINLFRVDERNPKYMIITRVYSWGYIEISVKGLRIGSVVPKFTEEGFL